MSGLVEEIQSAHEMANRKDLAELRLAKERLHKYLAMLEAREQELTSIPAGSAIGDREEGVRFNSQASEAELRRIPGEEFDPERWDFQS